MEKDKHLAPQTALVLRWLEDRGADGVDTVYAGDRRVTRLAARIADLKAAGYDIYDGYDWNPYTERRNRYKTYRLLRPTPTMSELELRFAWGDR